MTRAAAPCSVPRMATRRPPPVDIGGIDDRQRGRDGRDGADGAQGPQGLRGNPGQANVSGVLPITVALGNVIGINDAAPGVRGALSIADKAKIDAIAADIAAAVSAAIAAHVAAADPHTQYALESALAAVAFSGMKADVGLGNVDNTSDANKPVSTAQAAADAAVQAFAIARANHTGTQLMATISDLPTLSWGTYTPTLTNVTNLDSATAFADTMWVRVGNHVFVEGRVTTDATLAAPTSTQVDISLPIASNLANVQDLCGSGCVTYSSGHAAARIQADTANDRAAMTFHALTTVAANGTFRFMYRVI